MDMPRKIQLNDAQWNKLKRLAEQNGRCTPDETTRQSHRLSSNGLVASDQNGCEYLTELGIRRLRQGR